MRKNKIAILVFTCLLSTITFAQSEEFQIVDSLKNRVSNSLYDGGEIEVFPIETVNATCKKYEMVEVKDSIYESRLQLIDTLSANKIELTNKLKTFKEDVQELVNAKDFLDQFNRDPDPSLMFKWQYLKKAQECLDKTSHKIDLYRSKDEVFTKSGGKTSFKVGNYVMKQQVQINDILTDGSYLKSKIENLSKKIDSERNELTHINKTKKVNIPTGEMVRTILKVGNTNIGKEITGRYVKEIGPLDEHGESGYFIMKSDYKHFVKNEFVIEDSIQKYAGLANQVADFAGGGNNYIIKNVETGKLYYTKGDILKNWGEDYKVVKLFSQIDKLNIKRQIIDEKIVLHLNGFQCILTADIAQTVYDGDASVIKKMNESVNKYNEYNKLASDLAVKLSNHIKLYKSRLIKNDGIESWKKDTKECDAILTKMSKLPYAVSRDYYDQLDIKQVELHTAILDYVTYSKNKLGL